jgi:peroxiredoxin
MQRYHVLLFALLMSLGTALPALAQEPQPLEVGSEAPNFRGETQDGDWFHLQSALKQQPVVLVFYRGHWCPYCNKHLKTLQDSLNWVQKQGAKVVAVTPEQPEYLRKMQDKTGAQFDLVADHSGHHIMDLYGVTFRLSDKTHKQYKSMGVNVQDYAQHDDRVLPVPATYIIGQDQRIKAVQFDENYKNRSTVSWILEQLRAM